MWTKIKKEPALIAALMTLLGVVLGYFIKNPELVAALIGVTVVLLGLRQVVTPVTTMVEKITESATVAATETVKQLSTDTVGATGHVTKAGESIVNNVVDATVGNLLRGK